MTVDSRTRPSNLVFSMTPAGLTVVLPDGCLYLPPPTCDAVLLGSYKRQWVRFLELMEDERVRGFSERVARFAEWFTCRNLHVAVFEFSA